MRAVPLTPEHHDGLVSLLDNTSRGCFCRWWHFGGDDYSWQERCNLSPDANRADLRQAMACDSEQVRGVVALDDEQVVGWLKLSPAKQIDKLFRRRVYRSLDCFGGRRDDVLGVGCVLVAPAFRRRGVTSVLVAGAIEAARASGARSIEAFPRRPREVVRDDEMWMGPPSVFAHHGFEEIAGPEPYPVLRCMLR